MLDSSNILLEYVMLKNKFFFTVFLLSLLAICSSSFANPGNGPDGYTYLGKEGEKVTLKKMSKVAYGADGKFVYRFRMQGEISLDNATFSDPVPGVAKFAFYKISDEYPEARTLFINFGPVTLTNGDWNPLKNTAKMPVHKSAPDKAVFPFFSHPCAKDDDCRVGTCSITMPEKNAYNYNPFKEPSFKRCSEPDPLYEEQVVYFVKKTFADFNLRVVRERPTSGNYDMAIINYNSTIGSPHGGNAGLVCNVNRSNMIFFVQDSRWGWGPKNIAKIIAHEYGHTTGLSHSAQKGPSADPMHGGAFGEQWVKFENKCRPVDHVSYCGKYLQRWCKPGQQNTYQTVMHFLGPALEKQEFIFPEAPESESLIKTATMGKAETVLKEALCQNSTLIGIQWKSGAIIDGLKGLCADKEETSTLGASSGHGPFQFQCPQSSTKINYVSKLEAHTFSTGGAIAKVKVTCLDGQVSDFIGGGGNGKYEGPVSCPDNSVAVGIRGNGSGWLSTLGLICKPKGGPDIPIIGLKGGTGKSPEPPVLKNDYIEMPQ